MLISNQLKTIKTDLETIQNIKENLQSDLTQNFNDLQTQIKSDIETKLNEQNTQNFNTLSSQITQELNTKKTELINTLNTALENTQTRLQNSLNTFATQELNNTLEEAKTHAIDRINTQQIAHDIAQNSELKRYITNKLQETISENIAGLSFEEQITQKVLENLESVKVDNQKIADLQVKNILPLLEDKIKETIKETIYKQLEEDKLKEEIKETLNTEAKNLINENIFQIQDYNNAILQNALTQRSGYALIKDLELKILNNQYLQEIENLNTKQKQNIYISK